MRRFIEIIVVFGLRLLAACWRIRIVGDIPDYPCVVAFWHGSMLPVWKVFSHANSTAVVSRSKDGSLLATLLHAWGYRLIRGSSSSGGRETLEEMTAAAQSGTVLITPDGPRGPKCIAKAGAVVAAARAGVPLLVCSVSISRKIVFKSWDSFALPLQFSGIMVSIRVVYLGCFGKDITTAITAMQNQLQSWP